MPTLTFNDDMRKKVAECAVFTAMVGAQYTKVFDVLPGTMALSVSAAHLAKISGVTKDDITEVLSRITSFQPDSEPEILAWIEKGHELYVDEINAHAK